MQFVGRTGPVIVAILTVIPIFLWIPASDFGNPVSILRSIGQMTALAGTVLFCINFVLATRWKVLEHFFLGLNRVYIIHHVTGATAFILLLFHPVFLILSSLYISTEAAASLVLPSFTNIPVLLGTVALVLMIILMVLTLFIRLEYDRWKRTHIWLGVSLFLAAVHGYSVGSTLSVNPTLRYYILTFFFTGIISYLYRIIIKTSRRGRYHYRVMDVDRRGPVTVLTLNTLDKRMSFMPGQFAFLEAYHRGILKESHPFSILSPPDEKELVFAVKSLGDYTETLKLLEPGSDILVEGPYGRFSWKFFPNTRQIWIGAGIGISPFVGMLKSISARTEMSVKLYYCVRDAQEAVFNDELSNISTGIPQAEYFLHISNVSGRFNAERILSSTSDLTGYDVYICGPSGMMSSLKKQLIKSGVKPSGIHTEEFSLQ